MNRQDVLAQAVQTLDAYGFADLSMRRLAGSLGVQPGALYWHFANKQSLLLAVAEVILADLPDGTEGGPGGGDTSPPWEDAVRRWAVALRTALLSRRDGAELVASVLALRPRGLDPAGGCVAALTAAGLPAPEAAAAGAALVHYVVGHSVDAQNHAQAKELGVREVRDSGEEEATAVRRFEFGLDLFLAGLRSRLPEGALSPRSPRG